MNFLLQFCNVFVVQSVACLLCFKKIRSLIDWSLKTFSVQRNCPGFLVPTSFFICSHVRNDLPMQLRHVDYPSTENLCRINSGKKKTVAAKINNSEKFETVTA